MAEKNEPKVLIPRKGGDYLEVRYDRAHLQEKIPHCHGFALGIIDENELFAIIRIKGRLVEANKRYYSHHSLTQIQEGNENVIDGLVRFFGEAVNYAQKYNAPYILLQDLNIHYEGHSHKINGLATLLLDDS